MILTSHQCAYLPWCGLFDKIAQADAFVIMDACPAEASGYENRNRILSPTGPQWLTVPIHHDQHTPLSHVEIANDGRWQRKHWRSLELAYQRAPFWEMYGPGQLERFYAEPEWVLLVDLTAAMLAWFMAKLGLDRPITRASALGCEGTKSALVLDMCQRAGATGYIFGEKGRDYGDVRAFEAAGIEVRFQEYRHPTYRQFGGKPFVSHLSLIDLMMNVGPDSLRVLHNDTR